MLRDLLGRLGQRDAGAVGSMRRGGLGVAGQWPGRPGSRSITLSCPLQSSPSPSPHPTPDPGGGTRAHRAPRAAGGTPPPRPPSRSRDGGVCRRAAAAAAVRATRQQHRQQKQQQRQRQRLASPSPRRRPSHIAPRGGVRRAGGSARALSARHAHGHRRWGLPALPGVPIPGDGEAAQCRPQRRRAGYRSRQAGGTRRLRRPFTAGAAERRVLSAARQLEPDHHLVRRDWNQIIILYHIGRRRVGA